MSIKVLGTNVFLCSSWVHAIEELFALKLTRTQCRIICKCKSMADANRKCEALGLGSKVFVSNYVSETGNEEELELTQYEDVYIRLDVFGHPRTYISATQIYNMINSQ